MGIDLIRGGRIPNRGIRKTKTSNLYLKSLIRLYAFLARRTDSAFNTTVHKRLNQTRLNRYPISLSRIAKHRGNQEGKIVAIVGTVTNDVRLLNLPKNLRIAALRFTEQARKRIVASKGECLTFDQLAQKAPTGKDVLLLRGPRDREAKRHFGLAPGQKGSHTAPYVRSEGRKFEMARGRR